MKRLRQLVRRLCCAPASTMVLALAGCEAQPAARPAPDSTVAQPAGQAIPDPADSVATIAAFRARVAAIDADTAVMDRADRPIALGAGSAGLLTAWRAGPVWRRLRVEGQGAGFHTIDNYWLSDGVFLGARLEVLRPDRTPAVDTIWFRGRTLYRWTDPEGRHLNPDARSTQFQVRMMHARLDSLLHLLAAADAVRPTAR